MKFVVCKGVNGFEFVLNLSRVDAMHRREGVTHVWIGNEELKVKETPPELFRQGDFINSCVSTNGTELQQVLSEGRERIVSQLKEEEHEARGKLEKELKFWLQQKRENLKKELGKELSKHLAFTAKEEFGGNIGKAMISLMSKRCPLGRDWRWGKDVFALEVLQAVARRDSFDNPEKLIKKLMHSQKMRERKIKREENKRRARE